MHYVNDQQSVSFSVAGGKNRNGMLWIKNIFASVETFGGAKRHLALPKFSAKMVATLITVIFL